MISQISNLKSQVSFTSFARDIKLEHSLFALPFAFIGAIGAHSTGKGSLGWSLAGFILLAMVFARTAAMGFNRWLDASIDVQNPRTKNRAIPSGKVQPWYVLSLSIISALLFILVSFAINPLCGYLSPIALTVILGYSTAKRWTSASHLILGLSLAMAPSGGWLAVAGSFHPDMFLLAGAVIFWVAGFDILYSLMDVEFDRSMGLYSVPSRFGERSAYIISRIFHVIAVSLLLLFGGEAAWSFAVVIVALCLITEHILARNRAAIPVAFFNINAAIGFILLAGQVVDLL